MYIKLNTKMPVYDNFKMIDVNWVNIYAGETEDLPHSCPPPMGKPALISSFVDANLMDYLTTGRSQTGIIHFLNKTLIEWYPKLKSCAEADTYGSEYAATRICTDNIVDLCNTLLYLGVPLHMVNGLDASYMFGNNILVVNLNVMPSVKLQCRYQILYYNLTWEAQDKGVIKFVHMNGIEKLENIVTKSCAYNTCFPLIKSLLFWCDVDFIKERVVAEGSKNRSSTPPLSQANYNPQQSYKLELCYILVE